jgi:hypothetical protein
MCMTVSVLQRANKSGTRTHILMGTEGITPHIVNLGTG